MSGDGDDSPDPQYPRRPIAIIVGLALLAVLVYVVWFLQSCGTTAKEIVDPFR